MFGGLKWEHKIYKEDFDSKTEFKNEIERLIKLLEEKLEKIEKLANEKLDSWEHNDSRDEYDNVLDETKELLRELINDLEDDKRKVR